jgi:hypothetical protein
MKQMMWYSYNQSEEEPVLTVIVVGSTLYLGSVIEYEALSYFSLNGKYSLKDMNITRFKI